MFFSPKKERSTDIYLMWMNLENVLSESSHTVENPVQGLPRL
jgi:hypothetical protein